MPSREESEPQPDRGEEPRKADEIDLQALADKVYELLKKEARIERERRGRHRP